MSPGKISSYRPYGIASSVSHGCEDARKYGQVLGSRVAHVHVKDARRDQTEKSGWKLVLIGEGEVPVQAQLQSLYEHGYDGYVSVEWEKRWHPEIEEPEIALPQHISWLQTVEKQLMHK
ncbi:hypothetical protein KDW_43900 [Dictyobacter vulcani]|uniref:Xylose isomerase-like TIM barrel domain-containing protein n=1 Tax=Dictyobacter vulcani TaxID=2607529 RepID=A0A5J4KKE2_9CHLR|nr:TIM barrel protein [Dictyobacter vulcani]GER90228.1 hypothetical protein KDW_43900 [Dictyobacter vulcani]